MSSDEIKPCVRLFPLFGFNFALAQLGFVVPRLPSAIDFQTLGLSNCFPLRKEGHLLSAVLQKLPNLFVMSQSMFLSLSLNKHTVSNVNTPDILAGRMVMSTCTDAH